MEGCGHGSAVAGRSAALFHGGHHDVSGSDEERGFIGEPESQSRRRSRTNRRSRNARRRAAEEAATGAAEDRAAHDILLEPLYDEEEFQKRARLRLAPSAARVYVAIGLIVCLAALALAGYQTWRVAAQNRELAAVQKERDDLAAERDNLSRQLEEALAAAQAPTTPEAPAAQTYTVKTGDSLWSIAAKFYGDGGMYTLLISQNKLKDPNHLEKGQVLVIPPKP